jgi:curved DNA-binding protein CbpA
MSFVENSFEVLGVTVHSTDDEVRVAYYEAARRTHPDKGGSNESFLAVKRAFSALSSFGRRRSHAASTRPFEAGVNVF